VINLGYVLNVIEDPTERREVLQQAWSLCEDVLVVSALTAPDASEAGSRTAYNDGLISTRGTFQKYFTHMELRAYLQNILPVDAVPAAPNIFYLFRNEESQQRILANRYVRRAAVPRQRVSEQLFERHKELLEPFMQAVTNLGRLPGPEEFAQSSTLIDAVGSLKRALQIVARVTGTEPWQEIAARRKEDLLVYLALARFGARRPLSRLPLSIQRDIKAFAGNYTAASESANNLLFSVGNTDAIDAACQASGFGALVDNALIIEKGSLPELAPILRVYEGCARALLGEIEEANLVKLHRFSGKVTYLVCDPNNLDPEPGEHIRTRIKVNLRTLDIGFFDYSR
jgi:DNA phosphorothioation-associated putative methyltransferase